MENLIQITNKDLNIPTLYTYLKYACFGKDVSTSKKEVDIKNIFAIVFNMRDKFGKGYRKLGRYAFTWLMINFPDYFNNIFKFIPAFGRWDDLLYLFPGFLNIDPDNEKAVLFIKANYYSDINVETLNKLKNVQVNIIKYYTNQLKYDQTHMKEGKTCTLASKWAPTEGGSMNKLIPIFCKYMEITPKVYRKEFITPLRKYINITESYCCSNNWDKINYYIVPKVAVNKLENSFFKHDGYRFYNWMIKTKYYKQINESDYSQKSQKSQKSKETKVSLSYIDPVYQIIKDSISI